ncbi:NAD(P)H-dependent oxidoreductase [Pseudomonas sp. HR96]|uniref:NAD(P)H-dependent oxidoreductase n=1 Tax=Pseudomonas sp. HR96 TaxID=1027966 RepID=UPI002A750719|nr:NAD(P)H-dependent oxidoreductase [Pseudomonas sp. HR96]WPP01968.1 NAD(P)H-dependent oxidoreductase [Pseudomonas sp. HR96]
MNVLIVLAHPEPQSFNAALNSTAVDTLQKGGHEVTISDLYAMGWQAALGGDDFVGERADKRYLNLPREQEHAFAHNTFAAQIKAEQDKVSRADLVLFHFPVWWFSMPGILKDWVDRVFARGFAYSTGTASSLYEPNGIDGDLHHILWPIHNGILAYTGFTVLPPFTAWMPASVTEHERQDYLTGYAEQLNCLDSLQPLYFHPWEDYDDSQRLKPGVIAKSGVQWNPRAEQNKVQAWSEFTPEDKH